MMIQQRRWMLIVLLPLFAGCGDGGAKLVNVTGTATHNGKPVPNVAIHFVPENGLRSFALTDDDGKFKMVHSDGRDGVLAGSHKVWVELPTAGAKKDPERRKQLTTQQNDPIIRQILQKFGSADTTPIRLDITESRDIDLQLD